MKMPVLFPTLEHYAPILYYLGATDESDQATLPFEGIDFGTISMRMVLFENKNCRPPHGAQSKGIEPQKTAEHHINKGKR